MSSNRIFNSNNLPFCAHLNGNTDDYTRNGNSSVWTGTEKYVKNVYGNYSADFDSSNYIGPIDITNITSSPFSITIYSKLGVIPNDSLDRYVLWVMSDDGGTEWLGVRNTESSPYKNIKIYSNGKTPGDGNYNIVDKHACTTIIWDGSQLCSYVDGNFDYCVTPTTDFISTLTELYIGRGDYPSSSEDNYVGQLSDVYIHNITLTSDEVSELHNHIKRKRRIVNSEMTDVIESNLTDATNLINTDVQLTSNTKLELKCKILSRGLTRNQRYFGVYQSTGTPTYYGIGNNGTGEFLFYQSSSSVVGDVIDPNRIYTMSIDGTEGIYIDNELISGDSSVISDNVYDIYLFNWNRNGTMYPSDLVVFYCKIWQDDVLVRHFIPEEDGSMTDIINGVNYQNQGPDKLVYKRTEINNCDNLLLSTKDGVKDTSNYNRDFTYVSNQTILGSGGVVTNGISGGVNTGSDFVNGKNVTIKCICYADGWGENGFGRLLDNTSFLLYYYQPNNNIRLQSDASSNIYESDTVIINKPYIIHATRDDNGIANVYINGVLSGTANQNSGVPTIAVRNIFIGNRYSDDRTFNGSIHLAEVYEGIWDEAKIKKDYEETKHMI